MINTQIKYPVSEYNVENEKAQQKKNGTTTTMKTMQIRIKYIHGKQKAVNEHTMKIHGFVLLFVVVVVVVAQCSAFTLYKHLLVCLFPQNRCRCVHENGIKISLLKEFSIKTQNDEA